MTEGKKIKDITALVILLTLYGILIVYLGSYKEYMYEDEVLTYTSANSQSGMYLYPEYGKWYDAEYIREAVTAMPGHTFDFANTAKNSFSDNHPPLYTLLVHAVCSFFPGTYSKWYGLFVNILAGAIALVSLYFLAMELFEKNRKLSLCAGIIFAFSIGFTDTVLFIRNYILFMIAGIWITLLHVHYMRKKEEPVRFYILLYLNSFFGMMCHYYFATILFYTVSFFGIYLIINKKYKALVKYIVTLSLAAGTVLLVLPDIIDDILHSQSGSGNFALRSLEQLKDRFLTSYVILNKAFWGGAFKIFALIIIIWLIYCLIKRRVIKPAENTGIMLVMWTAFCYYVIGSATLTYLGSRYFSPVFAYIVLIIVYFADKIIRQVFISYKLGLAVTAVLFMIPMYVKIDTGLTDHQKAEMTRLATERSDDLCVFDAGIPIEENFFELEKYRGFMVQTSDMKIDDDKIRNADELVIYASDDKAAENLFKRVRECNPKLVNDDRLYVAYYSTAYVLHK